MPKISVILPVYNAEKYLGQTLDSLLSQTYRDFEVIAINDGSSDGSFGILSEYAARDSRIRVIDKENSGVSDARNVGIGEARGEYVAFIDADDIYAHEYLELMYRAAEDSDADVTVCDYVTFRGEKPSFPKHEKTEATPAAARELLDTGLMTSMCVKLFRLSLLRKYNILSSKDMSYSEDLLFCWRACLVSKKITRISAKLYGYRLTGEGATSRYHGDLYLKYKSAFADLRRFAEQSGVASEAEIADINLSFTRGLPAFLLMIARKKCSVRNKISDIKNILEDDIIAGILADRISDIALNEKDKRLYNNARRGRAYRLLINGCYMDLRGKLAKLIKNR